MVTEHYKIHVRTVVLLIETEEKKKISSAKSFIEL